ncbi:hypothetical protein KRR40_23370 [Niabella defluvii]|nr:hypothetical protein KRR40_23370 [Niabella sp. I65]
MSKRWKKILIISGAVLALLVVVAVNMNKGKGTLEVTAEKPLPVLLPKQ